MHRSGAYDKRVSVHDHRGVRTTADKCDATGLRGDAHMATLRVGTVEDPACVRRNHCLGGEGALTKVGINQSAWVEFQLAHLENASMVDIE